MTVDRPQIPEAVLRQVRQRCGFGCVLCGCPLYHYDHIVDWSLSEEHDPNNITLLCAGHHDEKTRGLLSRDIVVEANKSPTNVKRGVSSPYGLHLRGLECHTILGSNRFSSNRTGMTSIVRIDELDVISFSIAESGHVDLNVELFGGNGKLLLKVVENEMQYSTGQWDVEFVGRRQGGGGTLTLRHAPGDISLRLSFRDVGPLNIKIDSARLFFAGVDVIIIPRLCWVSNRVIAGEIVHNCDAGLVIGSNPSCAAFGIPNVKRYIPLSNEQRQEIHQLALNRASGLTGELDPNISSFGCYVSTTKGSEDFAIIPIDDPDVADNHTKVK